MRRKLFDVIVERVGMARGVRERERVRRKEKTGRKSRGTPVDNFVGLYSSAVAASVVKNLFV